jgi:hypothetical protein
VLVKNVEVDLAFCAEIGGVGGAVLGIRGGVDGFRRSPHVSAESK